MPLLTGALAHWETTTSRALRAHCSLSLPSRNSSLGRQLPHGTVDILGNYRTTVLPYMTSGVGPIRTVHGPCERSRRTALTLADTYIPYDSEAHELPDVHFRDDDLKDGDIRRKHVLKRSLPCREQSRTRAFEESVASEPAYLSGSVVLWDDVSICNDALRRCVLRRLDA